MTVACGNNYNLKPETVITAMEKYIDGFNATFSASHRKKMMIDGKPVM